MCHNRMRGQAPLHPHQVVQRRWIPYPCIAGEVLLPIQVALSSYLFRCLGFFNFLFFFLSLYVDLAEWTCNKILLCMTSI